jgi:Protein of unknown function (DUF2516)
MADFDGLVYLVVFYATLALAVWAITGIALLVLLWQQTPLSFLGLPAVIAAVVYLVDVRPAVRGLRRGNSSW